MSPADPSESRARSSTGAVGRRAQAAKQRQQHAFNEAEPRREKENALLLRELSEARLEIAQARYELVRRNTAEAFASAPIPSETRR
jgi:hypothetical protein